MTPVFMKKVSLEVEHGLMCDMAAYHHMSVGKKTEETISYNYSTYLKLSHTQKQNKKWDYIPFEEKVTSYLINMLSSRELPLLSIGRCLAGHQEGRGLGKHLIKFE